MRVVLWATFAKPELVGKLSSILGNDLTVVADFNEFTAAIGEADAFLCPDPVYSAQVAETLRGKAKRLRWMQLLTQGFEHAQANGVPAHISVTNAGDAYSPAVAVHSIAMLLALLRRFPATQANQMKGIWDRSISTQLSSPEGATMVIVGFGSIGQGIARLGRPFGARIVALTRGAKPHELADESLPISQLHSVLPRADAVVLALPLESSTRHLIGAKEFGMLRKNAVLINVSRGGIVDTAALVDALQSGALAGAGLDVTDPEPLPAGHPLWSVPNLILSPHVAGAVGKAGFDRLADIAAKNVERFLAGQPLAHTISL
jgi:D-2-hydroxyacid dehydrogenase (NADP+)